MARFEYGRSVERGRPPHYVQKLNSAPLTPTYSQLATRFAEDLSDRKEQENVRIKINNLGSNTTASSIKKLLDPFGEIIDVSLDRIEDPDRICATVLFESRPHDISGLVRARFGNRPLELELVPSAPGQSFRSCPAESLELGQKLAQNVFCPEFSAKLMVSIQLQVNRRMIKINFRRRFADTTIKYQVEMKFQDMDKGCIQIDDLDENAAITIHLRFPPMYWRYDPNMESQDQLKWSEGTCSRRVVDIPPEDSIFHLPTPTAPDRNPVEPNPTNLSSKLGRWTVIRLVVSKGASRNLANFEHLCNKYNLLVRDLPPIMVKNVSEVPQPHMDAFKGLPFEVSYLLESVLSFNYIVDYDLTPKVARALCNLEPLKASMILEHIISSRQRIWDVEGYIAKEAAKLSRISSSPRIVPPQCIYLRKVIVTPTTIHLQPPTVETSNRIVRQFSNLSDYFLRVEFSDEGNNRVWSKDPSSSENNAIYNRIFSGLTNGLKIGDREYHFLAFSASQLRDNSAWFFCSQGGNHTVDSIHRWMGDFSRIKSIAKYAARMGQCFSSTRAIAELTKDDVRKVDDIEFGNHNFSDGCGRISNKLAQMIGMELEKETVPVAFQIRLGGAKGVLVWHPALRERQVQIRPSMIKFDVEHYVLEVIKTSGFIPSYLNRQIIILLSALGVPDKVILNLKNKMVRDLERIETEETIAIDMLTQNWDENGSSKMIIEMIRAGFMQSQDPFLRNLLTLFKLHMLEELSKKARIYVPKGAYLLGVCDETGDLKEGEIFVQVSSVENPTKRTIIEGMCAVVRCPCFHPGDIRVVRAVNCRSLHHLHDVVVFNTKGPRGIPSMCSGGDLDGDDYTVIWDPDIVNNIKQEAPMEYVGRETLKTSAGDVTTLEIKRFFVQYAVSNNLGLIANAHLALSDHLEMGPFNGKCLRLAQLHSDAVDFPKSGIPADFQPELRPKRYPDFMEKPPERSYRSNRILGQIFRECRKQETEHFTPRGYRQSFNAMLLVDGYESYMDDAQRCKALYDEEVSSLMNQYGVRSDLEVASGFIMGVDMITNKKEHDVRKSIVNAYSIIRRRFRNEFEREFYSPDAKAIAPSLQQFVEQKAAAWYAVCYQKLQPDQPYTFVWIIWDHLCKIASRVRKPPGMEKSSLRIVASQGSPIGSPNMQSNTLSEPDVHAQAQGEDTVQGPLQSNMSQAASGKSYDISTQQQTQSGIGDGPIKVDLASPSLSSPSNDISNEMISLSINSGHSSDNAFGASSLRRTFARSIVEEPRVLRTDITIHAGSMFIQPDVDDSTLKAALGF
ncbi:hypothetical protein BGX26_003950 [Mortierella sp. AD094]|nr:hypothetical protein BGX26_003950 [Mortierella sp. AD094]